jgi:hypothetical protein
MVRANLEKYGGAASITWFGRMYSTPYPPDVIDEDDYKGGDSTEGNDIKDDTVGFKVIAVLGKGGRVE